MLLLGELAWFGCQQDIGENYGNSKLMVNSIYSAGRNRWFILGKLP
ncbi:hypothetical protein [Fastidiosibacter lacustris]|nr:hypothetical protein [Fastidiosibacter lacustris]